MKEYRADKHQYGMWTSDAHFCVEILWIPVGIKKDISRSDVPSWSWASRDGEIQYEAADDDFYGLRIAGGDGLKALHNIDPCGIMRIISKAKLLGCTHFIAKCDNTHWYFNLPKRPDSGGTHILLDDQAQEVGWACMDDGKFEDFDFQDVWALLLGPNAHERPDFKDVWTPLHGPNADVRPGWEGERETEGETKDRLICQFCMLIRKDASDSLYRRVGIGKVKNVEWFGTEEKQEVQTR